MTGLTMDSRSIIGSDDGYADTKVAGQSGCIVIPSRARHLAVGEAAVGGLGGAAVYLCGDKRIMVDPTIDGEDTCFPGYHTSDLNLAVVHHALRKAGMGGKDVVLAAGLPVGEYYDRSGAVNEELIDAKRRNLLRSVQAEDGSPVARIQEVQVLAQSICAWINHVIDGRGGFKLSMRPIGVIDIGGHTLDGAVVLPPNRIDPARSGTRNIGFLDVHRLVGAEIGKMCGLSHVPSQLVQIAVKHGVYVHENEKLDVQKVVERAKEEVGQKVVVAIRDIMGPVDDLETVLFVGGGHGAMPWVSRPFGNAVSVESPHYANARGMYKYLRYVQNA